MFMYIQKRSTFLLLCFAAIVIGLTFFTRFNEFGLYEDDIAFAAAGVGKNFTETWNYLVGCFRGWPQGRPLGFAYHVGLYSLLSELWPNNYLWAAYIMAYITVVTNTCILYFVLRRLNSPLAALFGAIAFAISPTDTTKAMLIHANNLQVALMFSLAGTLLFSQKRFILAYITAAMSLLVYESAYVVFMVAFFLHPTLCGMYTSARNVYAHRRQAILIAAKHLFLCFLILVIYLAIRSWVGESRLTEVGSEKGAFLRQTIQGLAVGPIFSAKTYLTSIIAISKSEKHMLVYYSVAAFFSLFAYLLFFSTAKKTLNTKETIFLGRVTLTIGIILLPLSYIFLGFKWPQTAEIGRSTSLHLATTVAWGFIFAGSIQVFSQTFSRKLLATLMSCCIFLWIAYGNFIQDCFAVSWRVQKEFFVELEKLAPDICSHTLIIYDVFHPESDYNPHNRRSPLTAQAPLYTKIFERLFWKNTNWKLMQFAYAEPFSWAMPAALRGKYNFPWKSQPDLQALVAMRTTGDATEYNFAGPPYYGFTHLPVAPNNIIVLHHQGTKLVRDTHLTNHATQESLLVRPLPPIGSQFPAHTPAGLNSVFADSPNSH